MIPQKQTGEDAHRRGMDVLLHGRRDVDGQNNFSQISKLVEANSIMNIRPLYDRIVVKRIEEQESTRNGIFIPDSAKEKPQEGEVMAIGKGKRLDDGTMVDLDVKAGDRILFAK